LNVAVVPWVLLVTSFKSFAGLGNEPGAFFHLFYHALLLSYRGFPCFTGHLTCINAFFLLGYVLRLSLNYSISICRFTSLFVHPLSVDQSFWFDPWKPLKYLTLCSYKLDPPLWSFSFTFCLRYIVENGFCHWNFFSVSFECDKNNFDLLVDKNSCSY
jgi:hypothetical protein